MHGLGAEGIYGSKTKAVLEKSVEIMKNPSIRGGHAVEKIDSLFLYHWSA